jgi:hypothetical protein
MNLEEFLSEAVCPVKRSSDVVGTVWIEPNSTVIPEDSELDATTKELRSCLENHDFSQINLRSPQGYDVPFSPYLHLSKYIRCITACREPRSAQWVHVLLNGDWMPGRP